MPARSLDAQIQKFLPLLGREEKASLLSVIKSFLSLKNTSVVKEPPFDIDEYNREIDEAEAEYERDSGFSHEEVMAMFEEKWKKHHSE